MKDLSRQCRYYIDNTNAFRFHRSATESSEAHAERSGNESKEYFMIYLLISSIDGYMMSIENVAIKRLNALKNEFDIQLVTVNYNANAHDFSEKLGILRNSHLNMYDFFQEYSDINYETFVTIDDLLTGHNYHTERIRDKGTYPGFKIYNNKQHIMTVRCIDINTKQILSVFSFDINGKYCKLDTYDIRGYKSSETILGDDKTIIAKYFYTKDGKRVIEKFYGKYATERLVPTLIKLLYGSKYYVFYSEDELIAFFLDCLVAQNAQKTCFISDRNAIYGYPLALMTRDAQKFAVLHSTHYRKLRNVFDAEIKKAYSSIFKNIDKFTGFVVQTEAQKADVLRMHPSVNVRVIQSGWTTRPEFSTKRKTNKIMAVARLSEEKGLDQTIKAFHIVQQALSDAELHIFGRGPQQEQLADCVRALSLENKVFLRGHVENLENEYASAELFVLSSRFEGLSLVLLEAQSHGVPCVAYDVNYGPSDSIVDGETGYLVQYGDIDGLAAKMLMILLDEEKKQIFIKNSMKYRERFSKEVIVHKWSELFKSIEIN